MDVFFCVQVFNYMKKRNTKSTLIDQQSEIEKEKEMSSQLHEEKKDDERRGWVGRETLTGTDLERE